VPFLCPVLSVIASAIDLHYLFGSIKFLSGHCIRQATPCLCQRVGGHPDLGFYPKRRHRQLRSRCTQTQIHTLGGITVCDQADPNNMAVRSVREVGNSSLSSSKPVRSALSLQASAKLRCSNNTPAFLVCSSLNQPVWDRNKGSVSYSRKQPASPARRSRNKASRLARRPCRRSRLSFSNSSSSSRISSNNRRARSPPLHNSSCLSRQQHLLLRR